MFYPIFSYLRSISSKVEDKSKDTDLKDKPEDKSESKDVSHILKEMKSTYNTIVKKDTKPEYVIALYDALKKLPSQLVRDCKIDKMGFEDMGPSKEFYPNHGKYISGILILNERILDDPKIEEDSEGHSASKFILTYYHELFHGLDEKKSQNEKDWLSMQGDWISLSDWSRKPIQGHKRLIIREEGYPELKGEWYYGPNAKFTRFYAKRQPEDDFADHGSYFVSGLKSLVPKEKREYFEKLLKKYYE